MIETAIDAAVQETLIRPGLYIGSWDDAKYFRRNYSGLTLCVLEVAGDRDFVPDFTIPIIDRDKMKADPFKLNLCHSLIVECDKAKRPVLVHCRQGVERSPLAVAWHLTKTGMSMDDAYTLIKEKRPYIIDRRNWLERI